LPHRAPHNFGDLLLTPLPDSVQQLRRSMRQARRPRTKVWSG